MKIANMFHLCNVLVGNKVYYDQPSSYKFITYIKKAK